MTLTLLTLAACGSKSNLDGLTDETSQVTARLAAAKLSTATRSTEVETGTLVRSEDYFSLGDLSGTINADRSEVALNGGGTLQIVTEDTIYAARFTATTPGGDVQSGILGVVTPKDNYEGGSATYAGTSVVTIQDGLTIYELTGDAALTADFDAGTVSTTIDGLNGEAKTGFADPVAVTDVAEIAFTDSAGSEDATFTDGTLAITSGTLSGLSSTVESSLDGAFFGTTAEEAGGVFVVDDSADGGLTIFGDFLAKQ